MIKNKCLFYILLSPLILFGYIIHKITGWNNL